MNQLRKCKVILLPTKVEAPSYTEGYIVKCHKEHPLVGESPVPVGRLSVSKNHSPGVLTYYTPQHLYITRKMELSDMNVWCIDVRTNSLYLLNSKLSQEMINLLRKYSQKVIASTDKSLNLPRPSQPFLKKYCDKQGIDEVLVVYSNSHALTADDKTITIKALRDNFTRQEVKALLWKIHTHKMTPMSPKDIEDIVDEFEILFDSLMDMSYERKVA